MKVIRREWFKRLCLVFLLPAIGVFSRPAFPANDEWIYVVRPGDTLIGIAERHFADQNAWSIVQSRNDIADPRKIATGTRLKIPARLLRTDPVAAQVLLVNGQASYAAAGGGAEKPLEAGALLQAGDSVRVAAGSNLSLRFPDGSRLLVQENSKFKLVRAVRLGATEMHRLQIELSEGRVESSVTPAPGGLNAFEIKTPALRMAVRGTRFRSAADSLSGQSHSEVLEGKVQVSGGEGKTVMLGAGFGSFATPGAPPRAPQPLAAAPEFVDPQARYERVPLRFAWKSTPAVSRHRAQVLDSADNLVFDDVFQEDAARWPDLPDGRYTLRVRSVDENCLEGLDAQHVFTLKARPEPPFARSPANRGYGESTQFEWTETAGAAQYHFQLASDGAFTQMLADEPALVTTKLTRALAPGRYYWRVASVAAGSDHGPFGDIATFEQRPVPASPQAEAFEIGDDKLEFRWRAGEPGQRYLLQLARTPDFTDLLLEQTIDNASITVPRPAAGEFFLRVKAIEADGFAGPFGATQRFTVSGNPAWWLLLLLLPALL